MKFRKILERLSLHDTFPLDPNILAGIICDLSYIDKFKFIGVDVNDEILRGAYLRQIVEEEMGRPYASPQTVGKIYYAKNMDLRWQRFCIVKELMHAVDPECVRVSSPDELSNLMTNICIPTEILLASEVSSERVKAIVDNMSDWRAVLVMIPERVRDEILSLPQNKKMTPEKISSDFHISDECALMLTNDQVWDKMMTVWQRLDEINAIEANAA